MQTEINLKLTDGERMRVARLRRNLTQGAYALRMGVSQSVVSRWEADELDIPKHIIKEQKRLGTISGAERAMIMRRRMGINIKDMAQDFGMSRYHIIKMESGRANAARYLEHVEILYKNRGL